MSRDAKVVIEEIFIDGALDSQNLRSFSSNKTLKLASQRAIEIISEASRHLPPELIATEPHINWRKVRDMGNFLRHEYHNVEDQIVWDIAMNRLDELRAALARMLARL